MNEKEGGTGRQKKQRSTRWSSQDIGRVRRLYHEGLSYTAIARGLSERKNAGQVARQLERDASKGIVERRLNTRIWEWSAKDTRKLYGMYEAGAGRTEIAEALECKPERVTDKIRYEASKGDFKYRKTGRPYTPEEDKQIILDYKAKRSAKITGRRIEREAGGIHARIRVLIETGEIKKKENPDGLRKKRRKRKNCIWQEHR